MTTIEILARRFDSDRRHLKSVATVTLEMSYEH